MSPFSKNITPSVDRELAAAEALEQSQPRRAFGHLERAHVLGQQSTFHHVRVHARMFIWAVRQRDVRELVGQSLRIVGAATKTIFGLVPTGNTGGSNISPLQRLPIPSDLLAEIERAR